MTVTLVRPRWLLCVWAGPARVWWLSSCENRADDHQVRAVPKTRTLLFLSPPPARGHRRHCREHIRVFPTRTKSFAVCPSAFPGFSRTLAERFRFPPSSFHVRTLTASHRRRGKMLLTPLMRRICGVYLSVTEQLFRCFFCQRWWETHAHTHTCA